MTGARRMTAEEREQVRSQKLYQKDKSELKFAGSYERIFPLTEHKILSGKNAWDL
jgi:hypothetical protein